MKEDVTDRPGTEETLQDELSEHAVPSPSGEQKPGEDVDARSSPESMREKVETIEISTLTPNE